MSFTVITKNLVADGDTDILELNRTTKVSIEANGAFGSGTVTLMQSLDGVNWYTTGVTLTSANLITTEVSAPYVKANLSGATAPNLNISLSKP